MSLNLAAAPASRAGAGRLGAATESQSALIGLDV
jgi:hypothetical protein